MCLLECPKAPIWEHSLEVNVLKGPKHCWSLHDSTFMLTSHSCQTKWEMYHAFWLDLKCENRLITRWRPITCVLVTIDRNSRNKFQRNYLQNQKHFLEFLLHFWNLQKILSILEKRMTFHNFNISGVIESEKCGYLNLDAVKAKPGKTAFS